MGGRSRAIFDAKIAAISARRNRAEAAGQARFLRAENAFIKISLTGRALAGCFGTRRFGFRWHRVTEAMASVNQALGELINPADAAR
jgi:hypothetical protein